MEWSLFQDYEETIPSAEINDTPYESQADFYWNEIKKIKRLKNPIQNTKFKKLSFSSSAKIQFEELLLDAGPDNSRQLSVF